MDVQSMSEDVIGATVVLGLGLLIALFLARTLKSDLRRTTILYFWHSALCVAYAIYTVAKGGDALSYYRLSLSEGHQLALGTNAVIAFTSLFSLGLGLSFIETFLVFNVIGFVGVMAFDGSLMVCVRDAAVGVKRLATVMVFLPSVSFWSSAIGKDALSFLAIGLALWSSLDSRKRSVTLFSAIALMLVVRPHMAALLAAALAVSILLSKEVPLLWRTLMGGASVLLASLIIPLALDYTGIGGKAGAEEMVEFLEERQGYNMSGQGAVDISQMSLPMQLFTYTFRPFPFELEGTFGLAASMDNLALMFMFALGIRALLKRRRRGGLEDRLFMWVYSLGAWLLLAMVTANLGISLRQKWMFLPMLIYLFIDAMVRSTSPQKPSNVPGHEPSLNSMAASNGPAS